MDTEYKLTNFRSGQVVAVGTPEKTTTTTTTASDMEEEVRRGSEKELLGPAELSQSAQWFLLFCNGPMDGALIHCTYCSNNSGSNQAPGPLTSVVVRLDPRSVACGASNQQPCRRGAASPTSGPPHSLHCCTVTKLN